MRRHGLRNKDPGSVLGMGGQGLEHPQKEELRLSIRDILIEEGGQRLQKDHQPDGVDGKERVEAVPE